MPLPFIIAGLAAVASGAAATGAAVAGAAAATGAAVAGAAAATGAAVAGAAAATGALAAGVAGAAAAMGGGALAAAAAIGATTIAGITITKIVIAAAVLFTLAAINRVEVEKARDEGFKKGLDKASREYEKILMADANGILEELRYAMEHTEKYKQNQDKLNALAMKIGDLTGKFEGCIQGLKKKGPRLK